MKNYIISGVLLLIFIGITVGFVLVLVNGVKFGEFEIKPVFDIINYSERVDKAKLNLSTSLNGYDTQINNLEREKLNFNQTKAEYDNVSQQDIDRILEAYKKYNYDLEWLWIVLGNYAKTNNLDIEINEPENEAQETDVLGNLGLTVRGRYLDVVDFVFDIENDKELLFKLDNMNMTYGSDNKIIATFDILTMNVMF